MKIDYANLTAEQAMELIEDDPSLIVLDRAGDLWAWDSDNKKMSCAGNSNLSPHMWEPFRAYKIVPYGWSSD